MQKIAKHIAIVSSTIFSLSSMGRISREGILTVLSKHYSDVDITIINNIKDLETLVARKPDLVFLGMAFIPTNPELGVDDPNKIWISDYLDQHGIAYTGSGHAAHELERNKNLAKQRVLESGLTTSPFYVIKRQDVQFGDADTLAYPLFVKPTNRGGGLGIDGNSVVRDLDQLKRKVRSIVDDIHSDALIEQYLPGREFSVAILKDEFSESFLTLPVELIAPLNTQGTRLLSEDVKSADAEQAIEVTDLAIKSKLTTLALEVFHALGARNYGRIDIRLDQSGTPQFLEANLIPSLIDNYGSFPKACAINAQLYHETIILRIARLGLARTSVLKGRISTLSGEDNQIPSFHDSLLETI